MASVQTATDDHPSFLAAAGFYAAYYAVLGVLIPFLGPFFVHQGIDPVTIGWLLAGLPLARAIYTPWAGLQADRGRWRRGTLVWHLVAAAAAAMALAASERLLWTTALVLIIGAGHGAVLPIVEARLLEGPLGRRYGPIRLWGSLAFIAIASTAGLIISRWPGLAVPLIAALLLLLCAVTSLPFAVGRPGQQQGDPAARVGRRVWLLLPVLVLNQVAHGPFYAMLAVDLERHGWSALAIGVTWSAGIVAETLLFAIGSFLTSRFRLETLLTVALALTPLRWVAFALPPSLVSVTAGHLGHAFGFALAHLAGIQLIQQAAPDGARRRAQSLYSGLVFGLGIAAGSAAAGLVYRAWGGRLMFWAAALLSLVTFVAWLVLERLCRMPVRVPGSDILSG